MRRDSFKTYSHLQDSDISSQNQTPKKPARHLTLKTHTPTLSCAFFDHFQQSLSPPGSLVQTLQLCQFRKSLNCLNPLPLPGPVSQDDITIRQPSSEPVSVQSQPSSSNSRQEHSRALRNYIWVIWPVQTSVSQACL